MTSRSGHRQTISPAKRVAVRLAALAALGVLCLALAFGVVSRTASASPTAQPLMTERRSLEWCPGTASLCQNARRVAVLEKCTAVTMVCWVDARHNGDPQYPNRWFYVQSGNLQGFVEAQYVWPREVVGGCNGNAAVATSFWATAVARYGKTVP